MGIIKITNNYTAPTANLTPGAGNFLMCRLSGAAAPDNRHYVGITLMVILRGSRHKASPYMKPIPQIPKDPLKLYSAEL